MIGRQSFSTRAIRVPEIYSLGKMLQFGGPHTLNEERSARFIAQTLSALKKCFSSGERASGRKKSVVNSVYLKERHGAYRFSTLTSAKVI